MGRAYGIPLSFIPKDILNIPDSLIILENIHFMMSIPVFQEASHITK